jgi:hypothetical protein
MLEGLDDDPCIRRISYNKFSKGNYRSQIWYDTDPKSGMIQTNLVSLESSS